MRTRVGLDGCRESYPPLGFDCWTVQHVAGSVPTALSQYIHCYLSYSVSEVAVIGVLFVYHMAVTGFPGYVFTCAQHLVLSCSDHFRMCVAITGIIVCSSGCLAASSELQ